MVAQQLEYIFLFGHRKQHGKDTSVRLVSAELDTLGITYKSLYFAKKLKEQAADKYGLDFDRMGEDSYKNSKPAHLKGLTVRDVLIKEGCGARAIWENVWAFPVYKELLTSGVRVGLISDFRYPNEYSCFNECFDIVNKTGDMKKPKLVKVLVHKQNGTFVSDGADDQLPDVDPYWDITIMNNDTSPKWEQNIQRQLKNMLECTIGV
jgi:hypothetical protein